MLQKEFSLGHGRIDLVGKDREGNICLAEVKTRDSEIPLGKRQIRKYQAQLANFLSLVGVEMVIRGIVVTPTKVISVGTIKSFVPQPKIKVPLDIPTSREIFACMHVKGSSEPYSYTPPSPRRDLSRKGLR